uniref:Uncharacterized protein n=1 Tax=Anguilla anguilla TaxID=7936 RepID=A0A0E9VEF1_ANGAN
MWSDLLVPVGTLAAVF